MKFDFEKHGLKNEPEAPKKEEKKEQTQEEFEAEIIAETERLGTSLEALKNDIDRYGGPEKFREFYEKETGNGIGTSNGGIFWENNAGQQLSSIGRSIHDTKDEIRSNKKFAAVLLGVATVAEAGGLILTQNNVLDQIKNVSEGDYGAIVQTLMALLFSSIGVQQLVSAIKNSHRVKILEENKQKAKLKFKMTDTIIKAINNWAK